MYFVIFRNEGSKKLKKKFLHNELRQNVVKLNVHAISQVSIKAA